MILFFDFDGVLHPDEVYLNRGRPTLRAPGELFMWAPLLEDVLSIYSAVDIVLSTSWVQWRSYSRTRNALPEGLRQRVIGATWHSRTDPREWAVLSRYQQIRYYLTRCADTRWLALDDDDQGWPSLDREQLICTNPELGISEPEVLRRLQQKLRRGLATMNSPYTSSDTQRLATMIETLFDLWGLTDQERSLLLHRLRINAKRGIPADVGSVEEYEPTYFYGRLLHIHRGLKLLFPENIDLAYGWVRRSNRALNGNSPLQTMINDGHEGCVRVIAYLDSYLNG